MSFVNMGFLVMAILFIAVGLSLAVATWTSPRILEGEMARRLTTGTLSPTRGNRTILSVWMILLGSQLLLSRLGWHALSSIVVVALLPVSIWILFKALSQRKEPV